MFFTNYIGRGKKTMWYQSIFSKLLLSLAVALLTISLLPFVSQAATFELGGNLGLSSSADPITETDIRAGEDPDKKALTITLTLKGTNTWADDVESTAKLRTLIDGLVAPFDDNGLQWDKVKAALKIKAEPTSKANFFKYDKDNNSIEIILPEVKKYDISADQIIGVSIAPSLLNDSSDPVTNTLDFTITADSQAVLISNINSASDIVNGGKIISISLTNNTWNADIININDKRNAFFESLSASNETAEWNKVIRALKAFPDPANILEILDDKSTLTITLPPVDNYRILEPQSIKANFENWNKKLFITNDLATSQRPLSFTIAPSFTTATLGGTIINSPTESNIAIDGGQTIIITLPNNTWQADIATSPAKIRTLVDGFTAASDTDSWSQVKSAIDSNAIRLDAAKKKLTITLPPVAKYDIVADQTITVNINATLLEYNHPVTLTPNTFTIKADGAATVTGTVAPLLTEADMITGGKTIIITLTNHKWIPDVISKADNRNALMDSFTVSSGSESDKTKWSNALDVIKASATFVRISDITVSITLPRSNGFNIEKEMEVQLTVPGSLIDVTPPIAALDPVYAFKVLPVSDQSAKLSGTAVSGITENDIVAGGKTIIITLSNDIWAPEVATDPGLRNALLDGLTAAGSKWANALGYFKNSPSTKIVRDSDTVVTITLPAYEGFSIDNDLSITLNIPKSVLTSASTEITTTSFTISAITAVLSGTAITAPPDSKSIIAGGKTIIITLKNATWATDVVNRYSVLLDKFTTNDTVEWKKIKNKITAAGVVRTSNTVVTIKLPPVPDYTGDNYDIHWISVIVPQALIAGGKKDVTATPDLEIGSKASARLSGNKLNKSDVVSGGDTITIRLDGCTWAEDVVSNASKLKALLKGFTADSDAASWNLVMTALQAKPENVKLDSETKITIELPPVPNYDPVNEQTVSLTIPKNLLVSANDNIVATNQIVISLPSHYYQGTLQYLLDYNILTHYVNTKPLQDIFLAVPVKYITSVVVGQTILDNTVITSMDIYTDSSVNKVTVTVNGTTYTTRDWVTDGKGNKFNIGFAYNNYSTAAGGSAAPEIDAIISVSDRNIRLQNDVTVKISGSKTYNIAPSADLKGTYSLYKLVNDSKLFTSILDYYIPADIRVQTLTP